MGLLSCMWRSTWAISSCDDSAEMKEVLDTLPTSELLSPLQSRAALILSAFLRAREGLSAFHGRGDSELWDWMRDAWLWSMQEL